MGTHQDYICLSLSGLPVRVRTQTGLTCLPWHRHRQAGQSMVRQAHHDNCHPEPVEGWIPRSSLPSTTIVGRGMTLLEKYLPINLSQTRIPRRPH